MCSSDLATGACFAHLGHDVVCADIDDRKIDSLSRGVVPIVEPGLDDLVIEGLGAGRLLFSIDVDGSAREAEIVFLCLPTPQADDGSADLSYVDAVVEQLKDVLRPGAILVNKSTVPVGTGRRVREQLGRSDVAVVSNPEFLRQGSAVRDFLHPSRVVVGGDDAEAVARVAELYKIGRAHV